MKNFFFTFGSAHFDNNGVNLKDYWVRVRTKNYDLARKFFLEWAEHNLNRGRNGWSMQYSQEKFNREFYPKGEYLCLEQQEEDIHTFS